MHAGNSEGSAAAALERSLDETLATLQLQRLDVFFLHSNICPDGYVYAHGARSQGRFSTRWSVYADEVVPAFARFAGDGRIGAWGITGVGIPESIDRALRHDPRPNVVQVVTNLMDSAGGMRRFSEPHRPREVIASAKELGIGVMGIRAVQAGALASDFDRPVEPSSLEGLDYARAAPFRELCRRWGEDPAMVAHRYALSMAEVDTVVLGVKNGRELEDALAAEAAGPLSAEELAAIDALGLRG